MPFMQIILRLFKYMGMQISLAVIFGINIKMFAHDNNVV